MSIDEQFDRVTVCIEGRCTHTTNDQCVASWRTLLADVGKAIVPAPSDLSQARSQALDDFANSMQFSTEWVVGEREDGTPVTVLDALHDAALAERATPS